jgi:DNA-binding CsgD family transcriptional regulator
VDVDTNECPDIPGPPGAGRTAAVCELLQLIGAAAILVDPDGVVVGLNDAAKDCLGAGLSISNRRLIMADPEVKRALAQLAAGCGAPACPGEQVVVARRGMRPLIVRMVPLHGRALALLHPASAVVMLADASRVNLPTETQLRRAFGLSDGEARLANRLAAGETLAAAASLCGISYETGRKRVKVVFEKTDTRRQSELVALITRIGALAGAPRVPSGEPMLPRPRSPGLPPALRQQPRQVQARRPSTRWTSVSTA